MISIKKKFLLCWKYEKDIWGDVTAWHKTINLGRIKAWPNVNNVPHLSKGRRLLQDFHKWLLVRTVRILTFSFEIIRRMKKKKKWKMKNWMRFFFLIKILWLFYGNLTRIKFFKYCNLCLKKKWNVMFYFLKMFEFWLPMFIYRSGFSHSFGTAQQWVEHGQVYVNDLCIRNIWHTISLYDTISFSPIIWNWIESSYGRMLFYASWISQRRRKWKCYPIKYALTSYQIFRAHFIGTNGCIYPDFWTFSLYWFWKPKSKSFKYYFSINVSNVIKHLTL